MAVVRKKNMQLTKWKVSNLCKTLQRDHKNMIGSDEGSDEDENDISGSEEDDLWAPPAKSKVSIS